MNIVTVRKISEDTWNVNVIIKTYPEHGYSIWYEEYNYDITQEMIDEALQRPQYFMYYGGNDEMFETWGIGPSLSNRDSDYISKANQIAVERMFDEELSDFANDIEFIHHNHFACGYIEVIEFKALENGEPTGIFAILLTLCDIINDHCYIDEEILSEVENEEQEETVNNILLQEVYDKLDDEEIKDWWYDTENASELFWDAMHETDNYFYHGGDGWYLQDDIGNIVEWIRSYGEKEIIIKRHEELLSRQNDLFERNENGN